MLNNRQTIAAVATAAGKGALAIVRISGEEAFPIAEKMLFRVFQVGEEADQSEEKEQYNILKRYELKTQNIKDDVMAVFFKGPRSFTGEDCVEIYCHGNNRIAEEIVAECIRNGARSAENGEFSRRAFLSNKIDLTQAEGIIDIINAESKAGINAAYGAVEGELFKEIEKIQKEILSMSAQVGAAVDYPEENLEEITTAELSEQIEKVLQNLEELKKTYDSGKIIKEGIRVAIIGEPNAGKSMLLNRLLGRDRAIVTDVEGTTRDTLEEAFEYKGIKFVLIDTAGLRETHDKIEKFGIERSYKAIDEADLVLSLFEPGKNPVEIGTENKKVIKVLNKSDILSFSSFLSKDTTTSDLSVLKKEPTLDSHDIKVSAKTGDNIEKLKEIIYVNTCENVSASGVMLSNARQYTAVCEACEAMKRAQKSAEINDLDCIISDLNESYRALGSVTGAYASDDIVNEIFSRFCVGK